MHLKSSRNVNKCAVTRPSQWHKKPKQSKTKAKVSQANTEENQKGK